MMKLKIANGLMAIVLGLRIFANQIRFFKNINILLIKFFSIKILL